VTAIDDRLKVLEKQSRVGLMTHVVVGYPSVDRTVEIVETMADAGVSFVELQIPFSEPVADGPSITLANQDALTGFHRTRVSECFEAMSTLSRKVDIPLLFMTYYNTVFKMGVDEFCRRSADAAGLVVPDVPLDEEPVEGYIKACERYGLHHIRLVSPASTDDRLRKNAAIAKGFVYCISRAGVTGVSKTREQQDQEMFKYLCRVRTFFDVPMALGFGISNGERIRQIIENVDVEILVVGSAVVEIMRRSPEDEQVLNVRALLDRLVAACDKPVPTARS
jgi:tryptophan synthase alpha subunit